MVESLDGLGGGNGDFFVYLFLGNVMVDTGIGQGPDKQVSMITLRTIRIIATKVYWTC